MDKLKLCSASEELMHLEADLRDFKSPEHEAALAEYLSARDAYEAARPHATEYVLC